MKLRIAGKATDYIEVKSSEGIILYKGHREKIRDLVERRRALLMDAANKGANIHTLSLDLSDEVNEFIAELPEEARIAFYNVYSEELKASASLLNDEAERINTSMKSREAAINGITVFFSTLIFF